MWNATDQCKKRQNVENKTQNYAWSFSDSRQQCDHDTIEVHTHLQRGLVLKIDKKCFWTWNYHFPHLHTTLYEYFRRMRKTMRNAKWKEMMNNLYSSRPSHNMLYDPIFLFLVRCERKKIFAQNFISMLRFLPPTNNRQCLLLFCFFENSKLNMSERNLKSKWIRFLTFLFLSLLNLHNYFPFHLLAVRQNRQKKVTASLSYKSSQERPKNVNHMSRERAL